MVKKEKKDRIIFQNIILPKSKAFYNWVHSGLFSVFPCHSLASNTFLLKQRAWPALLLPGLFPPPCLCTRALPVGSFTVLLSRELLLKAQSNLPQPHRLGLANLPSGSHGMYYSCSKVLHVFPVRLLASPTFLIFNFPLTQFFLPKYYDINLFYYYTNNTCVLYQFEVYKKIKLPFPTPMLTP